MLAKVEDNWTLLIVDDEVEVHRVTELALSDVTFDDRPLRYLSAYSAAEAREIMSAHADISLVLLDVVMESDDAGLKLVEHIRETLGNHDVRIVIRTGQAGIAPEKAVVSKYDINGFYEKTQISDDKLFSIVHTALSSYRDIKALRREIQLRTEAEKIKAKQAESLELLNKRLQQFASLAAHDIKEPMRKMILFSERLESQLGTQAQPEVMDFIKRIKTNAERLTALINDLQALSMISDKKPPMEQVSLKEVVEVVTQENEDGLKRADAEVTFGALPVIECDRASMELVFQNLISNAIKYRRSDEPLKLDISARQAASTGVPGSWEIRVRDNGMGIEPAYLEKVFDTFFRLHGKNISGSGVGLALCRQLLELHEGHIRLESQYGEGSTFIITLPETQPD